jgi:putative oxidoreductase
MDSVSPANFPRPVQINLALLILRIASAMAFLYHGSAILFGAFGGPGPEKFAAGHHWPTVLAYLVGLAQVAGGLAFLTGILFRVGAACIMAVMLGAIFLVHLQRGFHIANGGAEYALTQLLLAIAFLLTGPGQYSLTSLLPRPLRKF